MNRSTPLVSVVIPTFNRPQFLPRAVRSALAGMNAKDIEVIVVPNGPDQSWRESLAEFKNNPSVRVIPIPEANANIARNTGMANARGEFIRFLDDDDYLIPEGAVRQYALIQSSGVDIVSGSIQLVDEDDNNIDVWKQPDIDDFCSAVYIPSQLCLPHSHVHKAENIKKCQWNPRTIIRQDVEILINLTSKFELVWLKINDNVGVWVQHRNDRISTSMNLGLMNKHTVPMYIHGYESLKKQNRLNDLRRLSIAQGLWGFIHSSFFLEPIYWSSIIKRAVEIDKNAKPVKPIYLYPVVNKIDPSFVQWLLLPKRYLFYYFEKLKNGRN